MSDPDYMKDERAKSIEGFIGALSIIAKHKSKGIKEAFFMSAAHDIIYMHVTTEEIPEESEDGKMLNRLGFHVEDGSWAFFT